MALFLFPKMRNGKSAIWRGVAPKRAEDKIVAISKDCGRCHGTGQMNKGYKDIWGGWHKTQRCDVCNGSGRNPDYREKRCEYRGGCYTTIVYSAKASHPPTLCPHHKEVVAREKQEANAKRERENRERAQRQNAARANQGQQGRKENRESAQDKFRDACRNAGMNDTQRQEFSRYLHNRGELTDYMSYSDIRSKADQWLREHR